MFPIHAFLSRAHDYGNVQSRAGADAKRPAGGSRRPHLSNTPHVGAAALSVLALGVLIVLAV